MRFKTSILAEPRHHDTVTAVGWCNTDEIFSIRWVSWCELWSIGQGLGTVGAGGSDLFNSDKYWQCILGSPPLFYFYVNVKLVVMNRNQARDVLTGGGGGQWGQLAPQLGSCESAAHPTLVRIVNIKSDQWRRHGGGGQTAKYGTGPLVTDEAHQPEAKIRTSPVRRGCVSQYFDIVILRLWTTGVARKEVTPAVLRPPQGSDDGGAPAIMQVDRL